MSWITVNISPGAIQINHNNTEAIQDINTKLTHLDELMMKIMEGDPETIKALAAEYREQRERIEAALNKEKT